MWLWIFLGILLFIIAVVFAVLMLPVYIIAYNDENNELALRYKILHKTFGEVPDPENPIVLFLKKGTGISNIETQKLKSSIKETGLFSTLSSTYHIIISLLQEIAKLLKYCTVKRLKLNVVCTGADAAEAAINYGKCSSVTYPFLGMVDSIMKVNRSGEQVNISCDVYGGTPKFDYDIIISVRLCRLLAAFIRVAFKEARRTLEEEEVRS